MNKKVYLINLEWTQTHDNVGGVKGEFVLSDNITYEEYEKLIKNTYFYLNNSDLQQENKQLKERIDKAIYAYENFMSDEYILEILKGDSNE